MAVIATFLLSLGAIYLLVLLGSALASTRLRGARLVGGALLGIMLGIIPSFIAGAIAGNDDAQAGYDAMIAILLLFSIGGGIIGAMNPRENKS